MNRVIIFVGVLIPTYMGVGTLNEFTRIYQSKVCLPSRSPIELDRNVQQQSDHATSMSRCVDTSTGQRTVRPVVVPVI
jgi:hypothetical protein